MIATFVSKSEEAPGIFTFEFKPERKLRFIAGQFVELTLPHDKPDDRGTKRWFTISSSPGHETIKITTRISDKPSSFKASLTGLVEGKQLDVSEPLGDFVLPIDRSTPLVFVAGGIGITPFHSIVQYLLDANQTRKIQLIYLIRNKSDQVFESTFDQPFIDIINFDATERLAAEGIKSMVGGLEGKQLYISGPEQMTESIVDQFKDMGYSQDQIITDYFPGYSSI